MMKPTLLLLMSLLLVTASHAQKQALLIGKWKFTDVYSPGITDSIRLEEERMLYKSMTIVFKADKHYKFNLLSPEEGTWEYNEALQIIYLESTNGAKDKFYVAALTTSTLTLLYPNKKEGFRLEKITEH